MALNDIDNAARGWIDRIAKSIEQMFRTARKPLQSIPPLLLICELYKRPGLSAMALTSAIIRRLPEAGISIDSNNDGSPNKVLGFVRIMSEEIIKEFKENARVTSLLETGTLMSTGTGANAGGPVVISSINTSLTRLFGILQ